MIFNLFSIFVKIAMRWPRTRDVCLPLRQTYKSRDVLFSFFSGDIIIVIGQFGTLDWNVFGMWIDEAV